MTTIAFDGVTLAADRQGESSGLRRQVCKLFRVGDVWLAVSGSMAGGLEMIEWIRAGCDPVTLPARQRTDEFTPVLMIGPDCVPRLFERGAVPITFADKIFAMGSGRDFALAAMHLGCTARQAVSVASVFDPDTGMGVDEVRIAPESEG